MNIYVLQAEVENLRKQVKKLMEDKEMDKQIIDNLKSQINTLKQKSKKCELH